MRAHGKLPQAALAGSRVLEELGIQDRAWPFERTSTLLRELAGTGIAVLGGDVYDLTSGRAVPTYDNWHCDRRPHETFGQYAARSLDTALAYVSQYSFPTDRSLWVGLVMAIEEGDST